MGKYVDLSEVVQGKMVVTLQLNPINNLQTEINCVSVQLLLDLKYIHCLKLSICNFKRVQLVRFSQYFNRNLKKNKQKKRNTFLGLHN